MKLKFKVYECDDCRKRAGEFTDDKEARLAGWVISHDRKKFYCPRCAPNHKRTGRGGAKSYQAR